MGKKIKAFFYCGLFIFLGSIYTYTQKMDQNKTVPHAATIEKSPVSLETVSHEGPKKNEDDRLHSQESSIPDHKKIRFFTEQDFEKLAKNLSSADLSLIKNIVVSPNETSEKRQSFIFLLSRLGIGGAPPLIEVAKAEIPHFENLDNPHSVEALKKNFEISLRITALEAIDHLAKDIPQIREKLDEILIAQKNEQPLVFLVQMSLSGIESHRPGKIKRFIERTLAEKK